MARTRSRSRFGAIAPLAVLVFAGWQTVAVFSREPAFNLALKVEAPTSGGISLLGDAMYDRAAYFHWIAYEWQAWLGAESMPEDDGPSLPDEAFEVEYRRVLENANESLRHNPGDAETWMMVARARAALDDEEGALKAWTNAHALAPSRAALALERLTFLIRFMTQPSGTQLALSKISPAMVRRDLETMRVRSGRLADTYAQTPALHALLNATGS